MPKPNPCPICLKAYAAIHLSADVCEKHQNWFVITCEICGHTAFSDNSVYCTTCAGKGYGSPGRGSGDHRAYLRGIGQDDIR